MKLTLLAATAAALCAVGAPAHAGDTFTLSVELSGIYFYYDGVPGGCGPGTQHPVGCVGNGLEGNWPGVLQVTTSSYADGTYTGADLESVVFTSFVAPFTYHLGDQQQPIEAPDDGGPRLIGMDPGASVTIANGTVSEVDFSWIYTFGEFDFNGTTIADYGSYGHASDGWQLTGTAEVVPEPSMSVFMLLGLAAPIAAAMRRRSVKTARPA